MMMTEGRPNLGTESAAGRLKEVVADIYLHNPDAHEQAFIQRQQAETLNPSDPAGIELYQALKQSFEQLESAEGWHAARETARAELSQLPPDFLEQIIERFKPLMKNLPAGHGKGHMLRDTVNLVGMLRDPAYESHQIDEVELLAGITAGVFHDIGNSIIERHIDVSRVGAHAEVSAALFGNVAQGIVPPNLTKIIQYAISAHTHYTKEQTVKLANGAQATKQPYEDEASGGIRQAVWIARQSDRCDMTNLAQLVRDMIVHVTAVQDFDGESFYPKMTPEENFRTWFGLSPENISQSIIGHDIMYAKNVFAPNPYNAYDSDFFTHQLLEPGVGDLLLFLAVVAPDKKEGLLADIAQHDPAAASRLENMLSGYSQSTNKLAHQPITEVHIAHVLGQFNQICRAIEPAADLDKRLYGFEAQFGELNYEDRAKWARGLLLMKGILMNRWMGRLVQSASGELRLGSKIATQDPAVRQQFDELGQHLQAIAQQVITNMHSASGPQ